MPIEHSWFLEERIVYIQVTGDISLDVLSDSSAQTTHYLDDGTFPVHILINQLEVGKTPTSLAAVKEAVQNNFKHPSVGWTLIVSKPEMVRDFIALVLSQLSGLRYRRFDTEEEALEFLQGQDHTLPDLREIGI